MARGGDPDVVIVGGGFFGCCLALFLRSVARRVVLVEQRDELLAHASRVNQARVHTGFHYPRSFVTALRSRELSTRFAADFPEAIRSDFQMLYAIARRRSRVTTARFRRMFEDMGAPIAPAALADAALFSPELIEGVFAVTEYAFDWTVLQAAMRERLDRHGVELRLGESASRVDFAGDDPVLVLESGEEIRSRALFNVTYAGLNRLALASGFAALPLKHELAEVALVEPPAELVGRAVTVMDGPFFSLMPYPAARRYSLTHVRYTPHASWVDRPGATDAYARAAAMDHASRWRHMVMDVQRYLPCAAAISGAEPMFEVKTVLTANERDDGRPILLHRHSPGRRFYSVMGGKIDNIYDLFDALPGVDPALAGAHCGLVTGRT